MINSHLSSPPPPGTPVRIRPHGKHQHFGKGEFVAVEGRSWRIKIYSNHRGTELVDPRDVVIWKSRLREPLVSIPPRKIPDPVDHIPAKPIAPTVRAIEKVVEEIVSSASPIPPKKEESPMAVSPSPVPPSPKPRKHTLSYGDKRKLEAWMNKNLQLLSSGTLTIAEIEAKSTIDLGYTCVWSIITRLAKDVGISIKIKMRPRSDIGWSKKSSVDPVARRLLAQLYEKLSEPVPDALREYLLADVVPDGNPKSSGEVR